MYTNQRLRVLLAMTIILLFVATACATPTAVVVTKVITATPAPTALPSAVPTGKPVPQIFTWTGSSALLGRVPCCESTVDKNTSWLMAQMFQGLVDYKPGTSELVPVLAESWKVSEDGLTWTFKLKGGVTFSDGSPLTAADVKASFERTLEPTSKVSLRLAKIKEINALDNLTVVIVTDKVNAALPHALQEIAGLIQSKNSRPDNPIGTGPYVLKEWNRGEKVVLQRRANYWGPQPALETLTYLAVPEVGTRAIKLLKGEVDLAAMLAPDSISELNNSKVVKALTPSSSMMIALRINTRSAPYDNQKVRQAVSFAISKKDLVDKLMLGAALVPDGIAGHGVWATVHDPNGYYPQDLKKAEQLMIEAGLVKKDGKWQYNSVPLTFRLYAPQGRYVNDQQVAEYVAGQLTTFGFTVKSEIVPWTVFASSDKANAQKLLYDGAISGFSTTHPSGNWASDLSCAANAITGWCSKEFDALVAKAAATFDEKQQLDYYAQAQKIAVEAAVYAQLEEQLPVWGVQARVSGLTFTANEIPVTTDVRIK